MTNTNKENQSTQEEKCGTCKAYQFFKYLLHDSELTMEEAFHEAVGFAVENTLDEVVDNIAENAYEHGFRDGTVSTYRRLVKDLNEIADNIESTSDNICCEYCDCETDDKCKR